MVFNGYQWYTIDSFCKVTLKVQIDVGSGDKYNVSVRLDMSYYV